MSNTPLQLNHYVFTDVRLTAQPNVDISGNAPVGTETVVEYHAQKLGDNPLSWVVTVRVHLKSPNDKPTTYVGTVQCVGVFSVAPNWPPDQIEKLVAINGCGLLYASIREMIAMVTARGPYTYPLLPTMSFLDMYEQSRAKAKTVTQAAPA